MSNVYENTTVITGRQTRISFPSLFEPRGYDGSRPMYGAHLLIPKDDLKTVTAIQTAMGAAYRNGEYRLRDGDGAAPGPEEIFLPLQDGDVKRPDDPAYAGMYYLKAKNSERPKLFDEDGGEITDRSDLYAGCYARCKISFYAYNRGGNKGISCKLLGLRKTGDGTPLSFSACSAGDFVEVNTDEDEDFPF